MKPIARYNSPSQGFEPRFFIEAFRPVDHSVECKKKKSYLLKMSSLLLLVRTDWLVNRSSRPPRNRPLPEFSSGLRTTTEASTRLPTTKKTTRISAEINLFMMVLLLLMMMSQLLIHFVSS